MIYRFDSFVLDRDAFTLNDGDVPVHVEPMVFDLIAYFAESGGRVVSRDEIVDAVWGGRVVSDATVSSCIKSARQALGDSGSTQTHIRTVRGRGFQFVTTVQTFDSEPVRVEVALGTAAPLEVNRQAPKAEGGRPSVAVLPLQLLTTHERHGALGDAVSQDVILELARLHWLFVTARGSSFKFRDPDVDLTSVSQILGVRYLVTGTLAIHGETSVVAVELTHGASGRIIWAERFEQPVAELVLLRTPIATNIVGAIETRIQTAEAIDAGRLQTENLDAWSAYHRGLWHMFRFNHADNDAATALFARAVEKDPYFARAHAGLSFTHFQNAFLNFAEDREQEKTLARRYAEKSLELDPLDPFVNLTMGRSDWLAGDLAAAQPWLARSIELSPNYAFGIYNHALLEVLQGEGTTSADAVTRAISLSPIDPLSYAMLGTRAMAHMVRGEFEAGAKWAERAIRAPHAHYQIFVIAAIGHELAGQREAALACIESVRRQKRDFTQADYFRAFPFSDASFRRHAEKALATLGVC